MTAKRRKPWRGAGGRGGAPTAAPGGGAAAPGTVPLSPGRSDAAALAAAVLGPLALYVATLPRTVVLEDDGLFLMAGVHLGIAHPPGYPLYTLIVHLFTRLPFLDAAFLGHLSSAVLGALACGAVYCCARLLRASPAPALTAAWLFGVSEQFWSQAISLTAPSTAGTYYYGACVDAVTDESNTANNCATGVQVTVAGPTPNNPPVRAFNNCAAMHSAGWTRGVNRNGGTYQSSWDSAERQTYRLNTARDRDNDGHACE